MLALTRKTDYALVAMAGLGRDGGGPASARDLARRLDVPLPILRNILKALARNDLLRSRQGAGGGYGLARSPDRISVLDIVRAIEGPVRLARCCPPAGNGHDCRLLASCRIKDAVRQVHDRLVAFLDGVTLAELIAGQVPALASPTCSCAAPPHREQPPPAGVGGPTRRSATP